MSANSFSIIFARAICIYSERADIKHEFVHRIALETPRMLKKLMLLINVGEF